MVMIAEMIQEMEVDDAASSERRAFEFYKMAAIRGHAHGQYMLGKYFELGKGTAIDYHKASEWYEKSASQRYEKAISALKEINGSKPF